MLDLLMSCAAAPLPRYAGPERRSADSALWRWMAAMLDEIDYGMLLVVDEMRVIHANHVARAELDNEHPLQMLERQLRVRRSREPTDGHAARIRQAPSLPGALGALVRALAQPDAD